MPRGFRKVGSVKHGVRRTVERSFDKLNAEKSPPDSIGVKILVKLIFAGLAALSLLFFVMTGFDIAPGSVAHSIKDKKVLEQADGAGYPVDIEGNRSQDMRSILNGVVVLTDTNCMILDDKGREADSRPHYMSSPVLRTGGRYMLIYDKGAMSYSLSTLAGDLLSDKTEETILLGDIAENGEFLLITGHDTSFSQVQVFSKSGSLRHRWKSSSCFVYNAAISPSGSHLALCGIKSEDGVLKCTVMIQKVGGDKNLAEFTLTDILPLAVKFIDGDTFAVIGDNSTAVFSIGSKKYEQYNYDGKFIKGFDVSENGNIAILLSQYNDGQNCSVTILNKKCKPTIEFETKVSSPFIELTNNRVNLVHHSVFYSYNYSGTLLKTTDVPADCQQCMTHKGEFLLRGNMLISTLE